ncbi:MAG: LVIVD repeat-containing protein, partial [Candidatus Heimdallarchaeota archaeon]
YDIVIYNVTDPTNRNYIGSESIYYYFDGIGLSGEYLFANDYWNELIVFNLNDPMDPQRIFEFDFGGNTKDIAVRENYVVIANGDYGIQIFNLTDKATPIKIDEIYAYKATRVLIQNNILFVLSNHDTIFIYDISNIESIIMRGAYYTDPFLKTYIDFVIDGNYLTVMLAEDGLDILDVSDLGHPVLIDEYTSNGFDGKELLLDGDLLYFLGSGTVGDILIFDVSDYTNIELIKILATSNILGLEIYIEDEVLYMLGYSNLADMNYLYYYKIKNNNVYQLDGYFEIGNIVPEDLVVDGNYIYFASSEFGMVIFRKSSSFLFELYIPFTHNETSQEFIFVGGYIYIAAGFDGFVIYKALPPTTNLLRLFIIIGVVGGLVIVVVVALLFFRRRYRKALTKS